MADPDKSPKTGIIDRTGLRNILWAAASATALNHSFTEGRQDASLLLKAANIYSAALHPDQSVTAAKYGTNPIGDWDAITVDTDLGKFSSMREVLYRQMCDNVFVFMSKGPLQFTMYLNGIVMQTEGAHTALRQYFDEVGKVNSEIEAKIKLFAGRVYTLKTACEAVMVGLGAFSAVPVGLQIGVGLGYSLLTTVITDYHKLDTADLIGMDMSAKRRQAANTQVDALTANAMSTAGNITQEQIEQQSKKWRYFEEAESRALAKREKELESQIKKLMDQAGSKGKLKGAQKVAMNRLEAEGAELAQQKTAAALAKGTMSSVAKTTVKGGGVVLGLFFIKDDIANVGEFLRSGKGDWFE